MSITAVHNPANSVVTPNSVDKSLATNSNTKSPINPLNQTDTIQLSEEAIAAQRQEKYALKTDPARMLKDWLATPEPRYISLPGPKDYDSLLPETQAYIDQLKSRMENATSQEERLKIDGLISFSSSYGDKEMIQSDRDAILRMRVSEVSTSLKVHHFTLKGEVIPLPEGVTRAENLPGPKMLTLEDMIAYNKRVGISEQQTTAEYNAIQERERETIEQVYYGWLNGSTSIYNDPYFKGLVNQPS